MTWSPFLMNKKNAFGSVPQPVKLFKNFLTFYPINIMVDFSRDFLNTKLDWQ
jgi:hypothetical protein